MTVGGESEDAPSGTYPNIELYYTPITCQHCLVPACLSVCPADAISRDPDTGVVMTDAEACIGCKLCVEACPYEARVFLDTDPEYYQGFKTGFADAPEHVVNTSEKCTFCKNRLDQGLEPACMHLCPGRARFYGDLDDPDSTVSKLIKERESYRLLEEKGTEPSVYFLK